MAYTEIEAAPAADETTAEPTTATRTPWSDRRRRITGVSVVGVLFLIAWPTIGMPTDPIAVFLWIWAAFIGWNNTQPWRRHLIFARDWAPVLVLLVIYNISRGWASTTTPHVTAMIHADTWLFGWATGGEIPTLWLQHHLYQPDHIHWYDIVASFVYFSHFVLVLIVGAVLWARNKARWVSFAQHWFTLTALILATYFLYPASPPWLSAQEGYLNGPLQLDPYGVWQVVVRISSRGWQAIGLHHASSLLSTAQVADSNQVAAMPSMHAAYATMIVLFFFPVVRRRWWPLLLCYPLAMAFSLVYSGEHYAIDIIMGWVYVAATYLLVWAGRRAWRALPRQRESPLYEELSERTDEPV